MSVAKVTEIIASSNKGFDDAVTKGIKRADKTLKNIKGAWVKDQQVSVSNGKVTEYRVTLKVTFVLKD
ncbi:MAG: dodecin family protein [Candidatus Thiodiazotropha sp. (ex. Lucinisca nassula)]|nr:dodecin family protein [Candidatus Thiodiazotropha sp. (ex. Lucinisca nassula)]MBW9274873.1 dodecin family protein [Candidatus Thiodiazotropha sp. (ex. Lucinisca nassula)]PUB85363.1 MAG: dodecin domain-containing protein [gamma proteobacterium symbiont of Ctena orbiculata]PUB85421.1 MAG: dodecin domain-containing protein [gamma proteobacterium symbiont of Ctena orbiculata]